MILPHGVQFGPDEGIAYSDASGCHPLNNHPG